MTTYRITFDDDSEQQLVFANTVSLEDIRTQITEEIAIGYHGSVTDFVLEAV